MKNVVVIGGGNGIRSIVRALSPNKLINLSTIVTTFDSGKSTGILRRQFNIPAPGDVRRVLVDMRTPSSKTDALATLFEYRFKSGELKGINLGNLILLDLISKAGNFALGISEAAKLFNIKGTVIPVTFTNSNLLATFENGKKVEGEHLIGEPKLNRRSPKLHINNITTKPGALANPEALRVIAEADLLIFGPGDLYTSIIANFLPKGIKSAIQKSRSKKVYIVNLFEKPGETFNLSASSHTSEILKYTGLKKLDYVIVNRGSAKSTGLKKVVVDLPELKPLTKHIISEEVVDKNDPSLHSLSRMAKIILSII